MFHVEISEARRTILIRFRGRLSKEDFIRLDALGRERPASAPYDVIFDLTNVETSDVELDFVSARGDQPQVFTDRERIYVVPNDDLKLLVRWYAAWQESKGFRPPLVVLTLDEAFAKLGVGRQDFRPI
jgi:hypothetical protein